MGLDITAYSQLTAAAGNEAFDETGELCGNWIQFSVNPDYPGREDDILHRHAYKAVAAFSVHAGSYSRYNHWRDQLAALAGYALGHYTRYGKDWPSYAATVWEDPKLGPFMELINFSDCEGVIGAKTSAKLAADFAEFQAKADAHPDDHFRSKYAEWRKAFEMAANNGAVDFH